MLTQKTLTRVFLMARLCPDEELGAFRSNCCCWNDSSDIECCLRCVLVIVFIESLEFDSRSGCWIAAPVFSFDATIKLLWPTGCSLFSLFSIVSISDLLEVLDSMFVFAVVFISELLTTGSVSCGGCLLLFNWLVTFFNVRLMLPLVVSSSSFASKAIFRCKANETNEFAAISINNK